MSTASHAASDASDPLAWWREAKFGLFIHWGLYAAPAGIWKGEEIAGIGEWIMRRSTIPVREYEELARGFNPVKFDADAWVRMAADAGMKYIVITSKHHDGFAMYDSKVSEYDIVDATPFGRDPMQELAAACRKHGLRLCFYYSQAQDWHHPDADGNDWDYDVAQKDFARYFEEKAKPQVRELLTQYGPIGLIWFDTPRTITRAQSEELAALVHELQPDCLVNSRVGHDAGDYDSEGDNRIPYCVLERPWETPATLNDTWGFKVNDHHWKSVRTLLRLLADITSKGGNYLLNVGPTALGEIPQPSIDRLHTIGAWLKRNGEAIYGAGPSPFKAEFPWGAITQKANRLYLHVFEWPGDVFVLRGLRSRVRRAYLPADGSTLAFEQIEHPGVGVHELRIRVPAQAPDPDLSVIALELAGPVDVEPTPTQLTDASVALEACVAEVHPGAGTASLRVGTVGVTEEWLQAGDGLSWSFKVVQPGVFDVELWSVPPRRGKWLGGQTLQLTLGGATRQIRLVEDERRPNARSPHQQHVITRAGTFEIPAAGTWTLRAELTGRDPEDGQGVQLRSINLRAR